MTKEKIKNIIVWILFLIIFHFAARLIFGFLLAESLGPVYESEPQRGAITILLFDLLLYVAGLAFISRGESTYIGYRKLWCRLYCFGTCGAAHCKD